MVSRETEAGWPVLIQGGMGVGASNWRLARAVALAGIKNNLPVLGVVSGTGVEVTMANQLQNGDPGGHIQRALEYFPHPQIAENILNTYYRDVRKPLTARYRSTPRPSDLLSNDPEVRRPITELSVAANFVEVYLAKEGHDGPIGINHLEKIQLLHLPRLYGAMLAGVDYLLEGAGIPDQVPGVLDKFARNKAAEYKVNIAGSRERLELTFDPSNFGVESLQPLKRPTFLAIIASNLLAKILADENRISGRVDGYIIEKPTAGGHNAPPRGRLVLNNRGEPVYGERDEVDLVQIAALNRPFWLAGSYASPAKFAEALASGAMGIQVGTIFALSEESAIRDEYKVWLREQAFSGKFDIVTSPTVSPTGFPFKVAQKDGTLSQQAVYDARKRRCTQGHLVEVYQAKNGAYGVRCPAEPTEAFLQKGGKLENARGSACICNGLLATVGLGQKDKLGEEPAIITLGDDVSFIADIGNRRYTAEDAILYLFKE